MKVYEINYSTPDGYIHQVEFSSESAKNAKKYFEENYTYSEIIRIRVILRTWEDLT